jgi:hypothetical protein
VARLWEIGDRVVALGTMQAAMVAKTWGERLRHALISFELPAKNVADAKTSYSQVFGWSLTDFGPSYACTHIRDFPE